MQVVFRRWEPSRPVIYNEPAAPEVPAGVARHRRFDANDARKVYRRPENIINPEDATKQPIASKDSIGNSLVAFKSDPLAQLLAEYTSVKLSELGPAGNFDGETTRERSVNIESPKRRQSSNDQEPTLDVVIPKPGPIISNHGPIISNHGPIISNHGPIDR